eukprot:3904850-Karenia_brevis.AAC.1
MGMQQFSVIRDRCTIKWLRWLLVDVPGPLKIWPSSAANFRACFKYICQTLDISDAKLLPSSLRAGGITHYFLAGYG